MNMPDVYCDNCGAANRSGNMFCTYCGTTLLGGPPSQQTVPARVVSRTATGYLPTQQLLKQRYRILRRLGQGGMGAVYLAVDTLFGGQERAIKEMSLSSYNTPQELAEATEAFKREAMILVKLSHPHLPQVYDYFDDNGRSYLVMDFIQGETLEERLDRVGTLSLSDVLKIGVELCDVLHYLHSQPQPVVFRDLKPANIMLTQNDTVHLIDFGIARLFNPRGNDTQAVGSVGYAPPEQFKKATTPASDIYSLGATLHQMLSGNDPSTNTPTMFDFPPLSGVPAPLNLLICRMLEKDASRRPGSMLEVKRVLEQLLVPTPIVPPGRTLVYREHKGAVTAIAWSPDSKYVASASEDKSIQVWEADTGHQLLIYHQHHDVARMIAWSPDSKYLACASEDHAIEVWSANNGNRVHRYSGHTNRVRAIVWSPNGKYLASAGYDNTVRIWDFAARKQVSKCEGHTDSIFALAWSPDSALVASGSDDATVHIWRALTGQSVSCYKGHNRAVRAVSWSFDGQHIASGAWDCQVHVWDATNGQRLQVFGEHKRIVTAVCWQPGGTLIASASKEHEIRVWSVLNCDVVLTYSEHEASINALAWSPDGTRVASGSDDATVRVWHV